MLGGNASRKHVRSEISIISNELRRRRRRRCHRNNRGHTRVTARFLRETATPICGSVVGQALPPTFDRKQTTVSKNQVPSDEHCRDKYLTNERIGTIVVIPMDTRYTYDIPVRCTTLPENASLRCKYVTSLETRYAME